MPIAPAADNGITAMDGGMIPSRGVYATAAGGVTHSME